MTTPALFFSLMLAWSGTWLLVLFEYARATYVSWRMKDGAWSKVPGDLLSFVTWYFDRIGGDILCVLTKCPPEERHHNDQYDSGHYLRLFIGISAFHSGLFGLLTAMVDRTQWPLAIQAFALLSISVSTVGGLGHLFVAWNKHQRRWRLLVLGLFVWLPLGVMIYRALH